MAERSRSSFATTRWSLVVAATGDSDPARSALAELCETYWHPLYAFARRLGADADEARDLTQGFFAELLAKGYLAQADHERGRFRTFLLSSFRHYQSKERDRARAAKRGGPLPTLSLDFVAGEQCYVAEPRASGTPEQLFEKRWALTLLERTLNDVRRDYAESGKSQLFGLLEATLIGDSPAVSYAEIGKQVGMTEAAVKVAAYRLRRRYRDRLRATVAATVADQSEIDDELRHLVLAVSGPS
jgi:RNA polymerase sigma factor (sigma-70 family)